MPPNKSKCSKKQNKQVLAEPGACLFCLSSEDCEEKYGTMLSNGQITLHYFCMLFASGLSQNGEDHEGLLGFKFKDINRELRRGVRLKCSYCKAYGATVGCIVPKCRAQYHFVCGRKNEALFQFFDSYISFCREHRPSQKSAPRDRLAFKGTAKSTCSICMCSVNARVSNNTIRVTCCNNGWFHRDCIQRHATSSGMHFFKCALCNNKDKFQEEMLECGIYIPDKDASWELEPGAFRELYERHNRCDAPHCTCPGGRTANELSTRYELMLCDVCGSAGTHLACTPGLYTAMDDWACAECTELMTKNTEKKVPAKRGRPKKQVVESALQAKCEAMKYSGVSPHNTEHRASAGSKRKASALSPLHNPRSAKRRRGRPSSSLTASAAAASASWTPDSSLPGSSSSVSSSSSPITRLRDAAAAAGSASPSSSDSSRLSSASSQRPSLCLKENKRIRQERLNVLSSSPVQVPKLKRSVSAGVTNWRKTFSDMHITGASYTQVPVSSFTLDVPSPPLPLPPPPRPRQTKRSLQAAENIKELPLADITSVPKSLRKLLNDDVITGKNLGPKFKQTFSYRDEADAENAGETVAASSEGIQPEASDCTSPSQGLPADSPVSHRTTIRSILARRFAENLDLHDPNIASKRELRFLRDDLWTGKNLGTKHNSPLTEIDNNNLHLNIAETDKNLATKHNSPLTEIDSNLHLDIADDAFSSLSKEQQSDDKSQSSDDDVVVTAVEPSNVVRISRKDEGDDVFVDVEGEEENSFLGGGGGGSASQSVPGGGSPAQQPPALASNSAAVGKESGVFLASAALRPLVAGGDRALSSLRSPVPPPCGSSERRFRRLPHDSAASSSSSNVDCLMEAASSCFSNSMHQLDLLQENLLRDQRSASSSSMVAGLATDTGAVPVSSEGRFRLNASTAAATEIPTATVVAGSSRDPGLTLPHTMTTVSHPILRHLLHQPPLSYDEFVARYCCHTQPHDHILRHLLHQQYLERLAKDSALYSRLDNSKGRDEEEEEVDVLCISSEDEMDVVTDAAGRTPAAKASGSDVPRGEYVDMDLLYRSSKSRDLVLKPKRDSDVQFLGMTPPAESSSVRSVTRIGSAHNSEICAIM